MVDVREQTEGLYPVEICRHKIGRLVIRALNECGNNCTDVDLWDVIEWVSSLGAISTGN
jgi:hypothetical protein